MSMYKMKAKKRAGLLPGSLVYLGEKRTDKVTIRLIEYNETQFEERQIETIDEFVEEKERKTIKWLNLDGIHQTGLLQKLGENLGLHPMILEDIINTNHRPKAEDFGGYLCAILKMLSYEDKKALVVDQVSLVIGPNYLISFQENPGNLFSTVTEQIRTGKGIIRKMGADYLAYALLDVIVDNYFVILEKLGETMEDIEEELISRPVPQTLRDIHNLKKEMISFRKAVSPMREVIIHLERGESPLIKKGTTIFLRDLYDHIVEILDTMQSFQDMLTGMLDVYLSSINNKMNSVMKILTVITTIFIPLTLIAGIYGMNFRNMPELEWPWGYPAVLLVMLVIAVVLLIIFVRKRWL